MAELEGFPRHPDRSNAAPVEVGQTSPLAIAVWALLLAAAGTAGIIATVATTPESSDLFESPLFLPSFVVLPVLCGLAGWFAPAWGPYWALLAFAPYLIGFWVQVGSHPAPPTDADLSPIGFGYLLILGAFPWLVGYAASHARLGRV